MVENISPRVGLELGTARSVAYEHAQMHTRLLCIYNGRVLGPVVQN